jgi:hypothetical protein
MKKLPILLAFLVISCGIAVARSARPPVPTAANCNNFQGPQTATSDGQSFSNMTISVSGGQAGISTAGHSGVVIDTVKIFHSNGSPGILEQGGGGLSVHNSNIIGSSNAGPNIACRNTAVGGIGIWVTNTKVDGGHRGIEINHCDGPVLQTIEGSNQTGDFIISGGGAFVQWLESNGGSLTDFYNFRSPIGPAVTAGDVVNVWRSSGVTITHGLIDGVYSQPNDGVGVVFSCGVQNDENTSNTTVSDVTVVNSVDGAFCGYGSGGTGNKFSNIHASTNLQFDPITHEAPASGNGYMFVGPCKRGSANCAVPKGITFTNGTGSSYAHFTGWLSDQNPVYNKPLFKPTAVSDIAYTPHIRATNICQ